jgi:hypothetical protein
MITARIQNNFDTGNVMTTVNSTGQAFEMAARKQGRWQEKDSYCILQNSQVLFNYR